MRGGRAPDCAQRRAGLGTYEQPPRWLIQAMAMQRPVQRLIRALRRRQHVRERLADASATTRSGIAFPRSPVHLKYARQNKWRTYPDMNLVQSNIFPPVVRLEISKKWMFVNRSRVLDRRDATKR